MEAFHKRDVVLAGTLERQGDTVIHTGSKESESVLRRALVPRHTYSAGGGLVRSSWIFILPTRLGESLQQAQPQWVGH